MKTPIHTFLENYAQSGKVRCHMPGGKGMNNPFDITEISGADSLYECDGIIYQSEQNAAKLFGSMATLYSCGGSTLSVQTMLGVIRETTDKTTIIAGRYSHRSLINTAIMLGFDIKWAYPEEYLSTVISADEIERLIDSSVAAVFITSIDYYGGEADIPAISKVCKKHKIPLLVDNAHGAYRVFTKNHPISQGADMVADSAHKTLPALTGAAYLHIGNGDYYYYKTKNIMSMFGSSSPSYLILDSLDLCNPFIESRVAEAVGAVHNIAVLKGWLTDIGYTLKKSDPMRITIDAAAYGYTGDEFAQLLREKGTECEMSDNRYVVLLFSVSQNKTDCMMLFMMLRSIPKKAPCRTVSHVILHPEKVLSPREAFFARKKKVLLAAAKGMVCGEVLCPCPPCIPLVMPGERIDEECVKELKKYGGYTEISVVE